MGLGLPALLRTELVMPRHIGKHTAMQNFLQLPARIRVTLTKRAYWH